MRRLLLTLFLDARIQARNSVYLIVGIVALVLAFPLRAFFTPDQLRFFMPLVALSGVGISAFFLVAVLLMLERSEGTLDVILVSPLRPAEYLASKVVTVSLLAVVEGVAIAVVAYGPDFSFVALILAVLLRAVLVASLGIAIGVRYRSITRLLFPMAVFTLFFDLPVLWYLEISSSPLFYLWPTSPSLLLAKAAFMPLEPALMIYAGIYGCVAIAVAIAIALRSLDRFVVRGELVS